jgi:ABC-type Zn uptake system ZnuABC Zn-binding protein ZnuA
MIRFRPAPFALTGLLVLAACAAPSTGEVPIDSLVPADLAPGERLRVVASTTIIADVLAHVGGDDLDLLTSLPAGADPHEFEPTPREIEALSEADVMFVSGFGYEQTLQQSLAGAGLSPPTVVLSEGLEPEVDPAADPHVWLDPRNVMRWVDNAARALSALDPARADDYASRAAAYRAELEALDLRLASQVEQVPPERRKLVADHESLGHLSARYGLESLGSLIPGPSSAAEPSARHLADLLSMMQDQEVHVIFLTSPEDEALARSLAADSGARLVRLYVESLSESGGPADSYLRLIEYNLASIVEALKQDSEP